MYDDDEEEDAEYLFEIENGGTDAEQKATAYDEKGKEDRAFVDQQAKDYDEMKRKRREEIAHLKQARLNAEAKLSKKERELAALEIQLRKSAYLDTRERVASERQESEQRGVVSREAKADTEIDEIKKENREDLEEVKHRELLAEVAELKSIDNEAARKISLLEHELLRS